MKIKLIALGEKAPDWVNQGAEHYTKRLVGSSIHLEWSLLPIAKRTKSGNIGLWLGQEAKLIREKLPKESYLVIFDVNAPLLNTEDFAKRVSHWQHNHPSIVFLIGGPNGIDSTIKHLAQEQLSLSKMTFSHTIVRLMVAEQIYRAWSILQGHPYHK